MVLVDFNYISSNKLANKVRFYLHCICVCSIKHIILTHKTWKI